MRHGESEGNLARRYSEKGDNTIFVEEFINRYSAEWRLTDLGIWQSQKAGGWIRENIGNCFDRYYSSDYARARETAAHLQLPDAEWCVEVYLRERSLGKMDAVPLGGSEKYTEEYLQKEAIGNFYWQPPSGITIADLCMRLEDIFDTLHRECNDKNVIIVCHGEVMWAFRIRLERLLPEEYLVLDESENPFDRIHNCQVIHYTRRDPVTGRLSPYLDWMRSVCPTDLSLSDSGWRKIIRKKYTNEELLEQVGKITRLISGSSE